MSRSEHDHDITRRYLLGQLTDDEEQKLEERLLSEDDFFQEVELTKDELAQEYASGELTTKEREWLQENFLSSPEGKQRHEFSKTFDHYVRNHRTQREKSLSLIERLRNLWNTQPQLRYATATAAAVLVIAIIIYPIFSPDAPRSVAHLTVTNSPITRAGDAPPGPGITLKEDVLRLKLMLPQATAPGAAFRVEVLIGNTGSETFNTRAEETQSISVDISAAKLPRGQYVARVFMVDANGDEHRIQGSYNFTVE